MKRLYFLIFIGACLYSNALQQAIDKAPAGSKIELENGNYYGNIIINKPLIIEGKGNNVHIVGDNTTKVITIKSSDVVIKNLNIRGSGSSHEKIDSAIFVQNAYNVEIVDNNISDSLFGIDLQQTHNSRIVNNYITSKDFELGVRGDGIRLWSSHNNLISKNTLYKSRDLVAWYSSKNLFENNFGEFGRYSLHFMYANDNTVKDNVFVHNSVGIFFMYSDRIKASNNTVRNSLGAFGIGLGFKDCSNFDIEDNNIIYNARGIYLDQSPFQPESFNIFKQNRILYNSSALQVQGMREVVLLENNIIKGNMESVVSDTPEEDAMFVQWKNNYWDDYEGYDKDKDGIGDIPYYHYAYADTLWRYNPNIKFFYGSVAIDLLNFLAKLAPFSEPKLLAIDKEPLMRDIF